MATFNLGDIVESLVDAQHMRKGRQYRVSEVQTTSNFTGRCTSYTLIDLQDGLVLQQPIGNGHLVLKLVQSRIVLGDCVRVTSEPHVGYSFFVTAISEHGVLYGHGLGDVVVRKCDVEFVARSEAR